MAPSVPDSLKGTEAEVFPEFDVPSQVMSHSPGRAEWVCWRNTTAVIIPYSNGVNSKQLANPVPLDERPQKIHISRRVPPFKTTHLT